MRRWYLLFCGVMIITSANAQEKEEQNRIEQRVEMTATEAGEQELDDGSYRQMLEELRRHPIDINRTTEDELQSLGLLTPLQIATFFRYRRMIGPFISIYELQAVPGWDVETIMKLLPFIGMNADRIEWKNVWKRFREGETDIIVLHARPFHSGVTEKYKGTEDRIQFRYRYNYRNQAQFGISADKDAGESFFKGAQKYGFDFYSVHLYLKDLGKIKAIAIGDYTIQLGQGLLQWQGYGVGKSANVLAIKQQGAALKPYQSLGEYNFHRGLAILAQRKQWQVLLFGSSRKLTANRSDSSTDQFPSFTGINKSGYHRTESEIADRKQLGLFASGGSLVYKNEQLKIAANAVYNSLSGLLQPTDEPRNRFAFRGKQWSNVSIDYRYSFYNVHVFGEAAAGSNGKMAFLNGLLLSLDAVFDLALLHRKIDRAYHSIFSTAFTENATPVNEEGWYAGCSFHPSKTWQLDGYVNGYRFPWLKYNIDAPSMGGGHLFQLRYTPNKATEMVVRYRSVNKQISTGIVSTNLSMLTATKLEEFRWQTNYVLNKRWNISTRVVMNKYKDVAKDEVKNGFLAYADIEYKHARPGYSIQWRIQYFEMDEDATRIYAYENDVLYSTVVSGFGGAGVYSYVNLAGPDIFSWINPNRKNVYKCRLYIKASVMLKREGLANEAMRIAYASQLVISR